MFDIALYEPEIAPNTPETSSVFVPTVVQTYTLSNRLVLI